MFGNFSIPEMLIIMVIILLLFGAKRIPEIAGSMGKGIREFKKSMNDATRELSGNNIASAPPRLTDEELSQTRRLDDAERPEPKRLIQ